MDRGSLGNDAIFNTSPTSRNISRRDTIIRAMETEENDEPMNFKN